MTWPPIREGSLLWLQAHRDLVLGKVGLGVLDRVLTEMEDRRRQRRVGPALDQGGAQVLRLAGSARGDHRYRHRFGKFAGELEVIAVPGAIAIHAGEQYLAGAPLHALQGPLDRVAAGVLAAAMAVDGPAVGALAMLGVDRQDH